MSRTRTIEIPVDQGRMIHMRRRFPSTALSRLDEKAPELCKQLTGLILDPARRAKLEGELNRADEEASIKQNTVVLSFELVRFPVSELDALHEFCAEITDSVEGFVDEDGDPVVWKNAILHDRLDLYDCDVPQSTKVTLYLFAYLIKNGVDPTSVRAKTSENNSESEKA